MQVARQSDEPVPYCNACEVLWFWDFGRCAMVVWVFRRCGCGVRESGLVGRLGVVCYDNDFEGVVEVLIITGG